jgi:hypothetical protein
MTHPAAHMGGYGLSKLKSLYGAQLSFRKWQSYMKSDCTMNSSLIFALMQALSVAYNGSEVADNCMSVVQESCEQTVWVLELFSSYVTGHEL